MMWLDCNVVREGVNMAEFANGPQPQCFACGIKTVIITCKTTGTASIGKDRQIRIQFLNGRLLLDSKT